MLSPTDHDHFAEWGVLRVAGLLDPDATTRLRERAHAALESGGYWKDGAWVGEPRHIFDSRCSLLPEAGIALLEGPIAPVESAADRRGRRGRLGRPAALFD